MCVRITLALALTCSHPSFYPRKGFQRQIHARTRIGLPPERPLAPSRCAFRTLRPRTYERIERFTSQSGFDRVTAFPLSVSTVASSSSSSSSSRTGPGWLITLAALHSSAHLVRRRPSLTSSASFSEVVRPRVGTKTTQRCRP
jgi:hypothetical protein